MKQLSIIITACLMFVAPLRAEQRIYLLRDKNLPEGAENMDLRPDKGISTLTLDNIYASTTARYMLYQKRADSWWQIMVETAKGQHADWGHVTNQWYVKLKMRRTVNYTITLVLAGQGTANGYALTTSILPANGDWKELTIPLSAFPQMPEFTDNYSGRLMQLHSDLGYTNDEVGIDYCYLTDDKDSYDEGTVLQEKRYYLLKNEHTPLKDQPNYMDYSSSISTRAMGWQQWSYIPFPYYSLDKDTTVQQQCAQQTPISLNDVDEDWCVIAQMRTDIAMQFVVRLYLPDGIAYTDTIYPSDYIADGKTWNRLYFPLDHMYRYTYSDTTSVVFSVIAEQATSGEWTMPSLMITTNHEANDPAPLIPADPSQQSRIYLLNDGSPLPEQMNCTDYRLDQTSYLKVSYGNNTTRKAGNSYLTLLPTNGWWSADIAANSSVNMTAVDPTWVMHTAVSTTSTFRPINLILYREGNAELARYQLTEALLPVAQNGTVFEFDIPMSYYLKTATATLPTYTQRVMSFHSDNGGTAGVEVSMHYLYFSHDGIPQPDPQPGLAPVKEPELTPVVTDLWLIQNTRSALKKVLYDGRLIIYRNGLPYTILGASYK